MQFPLKPFLDRVIVEVIPIEDYYEKSETIQIELDRSFSQRSDRGIVRSCADDRGMPVKVGDVVQFDPDTAYAGLIYLNPADKNKPEKPKYLEIRIGDLLGKVMQERKRPTIEELQAILDTDEKLDLRVNPDGSVSAVPARPPFETFKHATCRGSYLFGSACGHCEKCKWEREHTVTHA